MDIARRRVDSGAFQTSVAVIVEDRHARLRAVWDEDDTAKLDPAGESIIGFEVSPDGASWFDWASARVWGSPTCPISTVHYLEVPAPPAGWRARSWLRAARTASIAVGCIGLLIEGNRGLVRPSSHNSVAFDNSVNASATAGSLTTGSFTISGSDRAFGLGVGNNQSSITVTSTTCGGVSGTSAGARAINGNTSMHLWYGVSPATGSQTADVTMSDTFAQISLHALTFTGVDQTTTIEGYASANAASGGTSDDIATTVGVTPATGDMVFCACKGGGGGTLTAVGSVTRRTHDQGSRSATGTQPGSAGASVAFDGEFSDAWAIGAVNFIEASAGSSRPVKMAGHWGGVAAEDGGFAG
jgi:hypothetical protein